MMFSTPSFWYRRSGFLSTLLAPLSLVYAAGRALDVALNQRQHFAAPVVCVGNLVAGGAGKTPTTLALAALLKMQNHAPHVVTRGHGGRLAGPHLVTEADNSHDVGDEALLLAPHVPVWVARDRAAGIGSALAHHASVVLLDDGLQNTKIAARLNVLVIDGASGFGNGQLLPAGPLRETVDAARPRVGGIVMIGDDLHGAAQNFPGTPVFAADIVPDASALDIGQKYLAFSGIARPEKFFTTARQAGLLMVDHVSFPDHHHFTAQERKALQDRAAHVGAQLLTTEKDAMRWPENERKSLATLPISLQFRAPESVAAFLAKAIHHA